MRRTTANAITPINQNGRKQRDEEFFEITSSLLKAREKPRVQGAIGFDFVSHWLKNWRESFTPISKRSNHNRPISIYSGARDLLQVLSTESRLRGMAYARGRLLDCLYALELSVFLLNTDFGSVWLMIEATLNEQNP